MKILILGSGGREHALAWKLAASAEKVWCAPGNDGMAGSVECLRVDLKDVPGVADLAARIDADLTIVGPEAPLVLGIADEFASRGLVLLGPGKDAAQLEGSKIFAKRFLERHGIPTASVIGICDSAGEAREALKSTRWPAVIKADGLCAGKGVLVAASMEEADAFIHRLWDVGEFGDAGKRVLIEEGLAGEELSYIILTDGKDFIRMAPARDHKRAYDNDQGPNTGGMGAYSMDSILPAALDELVVSTIVRPTLEGLRRDGLEYHGFLYFGLMLTADGPKVLEYNCRLGDPETEAVLPRVDFDLGEACWRAAQGELEDFKANWLPGASACVVIAAQGYPGNPRSGTPIHGLENAANVPGAVIFHAGTRREGTVWKTNGGRVLIVSARGENLGSACGIAYEAVGKIEIEGSFYRRDIGRRAAAGQEAGHAPKVQEQAATKTASAPRRRET